MATQAPKVKPDGPDGLNCPQFRKPMSEVCKTCGWWTELEQHDEHGHFAGNAYDCAMNIAAFGVMRTAHEVRCATASADKTANAVHSMHGNMAETNMKIIEGLKPALQLMVGAPSLRAIEGDRHEKDN